MKTVCKYGIVCLMSIIIGFAIGFLWQKNAWMNLDNARKSNTWEIIYYIFSIIGSLGTVGAVIVALGKEAILRHLYHPQLDIEFAEEFGISEDIDTEQQTPKTETYDCELKITNNGSVAAKTCEVIIEQVGYSDKKGRSLRYMKDYQSKTSKLVWESSKVEIPKGISKELRLFNIASPGSLGTPGEESTTCHLELNGFKLKDNKSSKGYWEISYYIVYDNGEHNHFKLTIEWNGEWKSRKTEMKDVLHVNLIK